MYIDLLVGIFWNKFYMCRSILNETFAEIISAPLAGTSDPFVGS